MDKNQIFGFILIFAVVIGWSLFTTPSPEELAKQKAYQDSIAATQVVESEVTPAISDQSNVVVQKQEVASDSLLQVMQSAKLGAFAPSSSSSSKTYTLENDKIILTFDAKGGFISKAELKEHVVSIDKDSGEDIEKRPLVFMSDEEDQFELVLPVAGAANNRISTADLHFEGNKRNNTLTLKAPASNGGALSFVYTLNPDSYELDYDVVFDNLGGVINNDGQALSLKWENHLEKLERSIDFEKRYSTVYFKESEEDPDYCGCMSDSEEDLSNKKIEWISHSNQFFNVSLLGRDKPFSSGKFSTIMGEEEDEDLKVITSTLGIPYSGGQETFSMNMFVGPNDFNSLASYDNELEQIIPFGRSIFGSINRHVIRPSFEFLSKYVGSKGLVILILILVLKIMLYPLMYKMLSSQAKMSALKPELAGLKEKFKEEPQKLQMEQMKIYQSYGVSPFGGCFPMLLQMPIWYALFRFFPASITFRQEPFLWAPDLSSFDEFFQLPFEIPFGFGSHLSLFTLLWAISMLAYTYYNTKHMDMSANPAMKYVQYLMPLMFLGFFNNYASGLTCYMLFSNLINIIQTVGTKTLLFNEEKILAELKEKKANKPAKKGGGFQARMEKMLEEQKKVAAQQQSKKKRRK